MMLFNNINLTDIADRFRCWAVLILYSKVNYQCQIRASERHDWILGGRKHWSWGRPPSSGEIAQICRIITQLLQRTFILFYIHKPRPDSAGPHLQRGEQSVMFCVLSASFESSQTSYLNALGVFLRDAVHEQQSFNNENCWKRWSQCYRVNLFFIPSILDRGPVYFCTCRVCCLSPSP